MPSPAPLLGPPLASTETDLDAWLGGLPADGITLVQGPTACGRTTFLRAVAEGVHGRGGSVHWNGTEPLPLTSVPSSAFFAAVHTNLQDLIGHVTTLKPTRSALVVIDDAGSYPNPASTTSGGTTATWGTFIRRMASWDAPVLLAAKTRRVGAFQAAGVVQTAGLGRGATFTASLVLELEPVARTAGKSHGVVVETRIVKSRRQQPGATTKFWLRPGHEKPLVFA